MRLETTDRAEILPASPAGPAGRWREAGAATARRMRLLPAGTLRPKTYRRRRVELQQFIAAVTAKPETENSAWIVGNARLISAAEQEAFQFASGMHELPASAGNAGLAEPAVRGLARGYLIESGDVLHETTLAAFLEGVQTVQPLEMGEIWGLKPALQMEIVERLFLAPPADWRNLVASLRQIAEANWPELFEAASSVHRLLARDPAGAYLDMDFESRDRYRRVVADLAKSSRQSELEVAQAAIELSRGADRTPGSRAALRRTHVGYYLVDRGRALLERTVGYRPPIRTWPARFALRHPTFFYLGGITAVTLLILFGVLLALGSFHLAAVVILLLLLPATQAATDFINNLAAALLEPRVLTKLDFSAGIPDSCATMVAVPTLLLNESQVRQLVSDLEIRFLANRAPNLYFALLTDLPDSDEPRDHDHDALVLECRERIESLNRRYGKDGRTPFYLFHRHRSYNPSEGRWMGWERKRGKLLDLNQLLRGGFDAFPIKVGDESILSAIRYVIALDSDTRLPRECAAKLIGAIAHPLNLAVIDPATRAVIAGYGILQPRIGIGVQSAARSRLASLYSGQTGFDIYSRAVSDVYQDLFGEGVFTGKGIYDVDAMRESLERRFPENALLSHDLIEGAYARTALVSDIELIDDYPSHFSAYSRRKHRWVRGDWQIMRWLHPRVPGFRGRVLENSISLISQWKILDNLRRSLLEPSLLWLFLGSWLFLPGSAAWWTALTLAILFMPVGSGLLFAMWRVPRSWRLVGAWARKTARWFLEGFATTFCTLVFLLHQSLISLDAIFRSVARVWVTRRKLLEWETAAEAEAENRPKATVDIYLEWTPWIAIVIALAVAWARPSSLIAAAPILVVWVGSRAFSDWLNRPPRVADRRSSTADLELLRESAGRIWRFFHDWSSPSTNWLIPDHVREDGVPELRLSPTNLGMLLNSRIAAVHLGLSSIEEFVFATNQTLRRVLSMPKYRGHLYNWHDIGSLQPLPPACISTVDSGNLAACLWTLKQAAAAFRAGPDAVAQAFLPAGPSKPEITPALASGLQSIADTCDALVNAMDFGFLYNRRKKVLAIGYDVDAGRCEASHYDLLASEARIAGFVAIAKGDIPQESWFHLGRAHTLHAGERVLLSWTGTMFEYLMPALWMRTYPDTIMGQSMRAAVRIQREYARSKGVPWGISESAFRGDGPGGYAYAPFGIAALSVRNNAPPSVVISPYSSFLAACVEPAQAIANLRRIEGLGFAGRYGFYESIDYRQGEADVIRIWMAHHQGMSLLAILDLLCDGVFRRYFHAEPQVQATELLLDERVPAASLAEIQPEAF